MKVQYRAVSQYPPSPLWCAPSSGVHGAGHGSRCDTSWRVLSAASAPSVCSEWTSAAGCAPWSLSGITKFWILTVVWTVVLQPCIVTAGAHVIRCERMLRVSVDAHQTSFVVMFFAEYLHQEVMFPLSFLHLADKGCLLSSTKSYTKDLKGTAFNGELAVHFTWYC